MKNEDGRLKIERRICRTTIHISERKTKTEAENKPSSDLDLHVKTEHPEKTAGRRAAERAFSAGRHCCEGCADV